MNAPMTEEEIAVVLADHLKWLRGEGGQRADMRYANMRGADMRYANMRGADMQGADMEGADMRYANMRYADMQGADMQRADMRYADMQRADMRGANMRYADMQGANMRYANMQGADMQGANMQGADMEGADMEGAKIDGDKTAIGILRRATRSDGYEFFLWHCQEGFFIKAGCHFFTMTEARQHWTATRAGTPLGDESLDILNFFDAAIKRQEATQ
ncbi:COG1357 Pentapeptide repeats containing protein [uncultured Caudovirales phage]|uniref:COG1357 Pentapeptide repeats containing protein n=1 Tax=uncultured Caudovirales phage TaxID=2100421 RepID=A0A6J5NJK4_9CAUD|nr:COG1357 Pentapeptide repeats containing protein [uncultured Caudovirales phage]